jgi:hypothetical protein
MSDPIRCRLAVLAAAASLALAASVPGRAADLGGDCCADLEERVAALESTTVRKGNKHVSLTISGRVHAGVMWWQDNSTGLDPNYDFDHHSDAYFGNTAGSANRVLLDGEAKISPDLAAGFTMTVRTPFGGVDSQIEHQTSGTPLSEDTYVYLRSERLGELRLGNMYSASDDAYYNDFGSPGIVGGLAAQRFVPDFALRASNESGVLTDVTYSHVLYELSDSAENRLMYVSPTLGGFVFKADLGGDDTASAGLNYSVTKGRFNLSAGVGYQVSRREDGLSPGGDQGVQLDSSAAEPLTDAEHTTLRALGLSASVFDSSTGLFLTGEYSVAYADIAGRQDATNWYARTGWTKDISGMGATTLDVQYERTDNLLANNTSAHLWGVGLDQAIDAVASNVYLHYQHDSFDTSGVVTAADNLDTGVECGATCTVDKQSIDSVTAGMIVRF